MKLTVLCEDTARGSLGCEHGLSLYIESGERRLLFDTGQTELFARNADALGIDLSSVEHCVISHGHYDHGGGLGCFLGRNEKAPVYLSRYAFEKHFNTRGQFNGLDPALRGNSRMVFTDGVTEIAPGITLYTSLGTGTPTAADAFGLGMWENGRIVPDDFRHEQYLLIEETGRRILISGCSHRGVLNIEEHFCPDVFIGGFHLYDLVPGERLGEIARRLDGHETRYFTCHCTGTEQYAFLKEHMRRIRYLAAGDSLEI